MAVDIERNKALTLFVAVICIVAIGMAAATITTAVVVNTEGGSGGPGYVGTDDDGGEEDRSVGDFDAEGGVDDPSTMQLDTCIPFLTESYGILAFVGVFVGVLYLLYRQWSLSMAMLSTYALTPVMLIAYFMLTACPEAGGGGVAEGTQNGTVIGDLAGTEVFGTPDISPIWLVLVFAIALFGAGAVLFSASRDEVVEEVDDVEESDPDAGDLAEAAGRAADRLQRRDANVDNEVFSAWHEMTQLLNLTNAASVTAGEFADAAIDAGLRREDVQDLTVLFEEVRYGNAEPDAEREQDAIDIFRQIESAYDNEPSTTADTNNSTEPGGNQ